MEHTNAQNPIRENERYRPPDVVLLPLERLIGEDQFVIALRIDDCYDNVLVIIGKSFRKRLIDRRLNVIFDEYVFVQEHSGNADHARSLIEYRFHDDPVLWIAFIDG